MRATLAMLLAGSMAATLPLPAAEPPPVRLIVKPLLCVVDKGATNCNVLFDIQWTSVLPAEYCLNEEAVPAPVRCWPNSVAGETQHRRYVSEDFIFWLSPPSGTEKVAEVKVEVLRVGSDDRRRERRTRHVWDVL